MMVQFINIWNITCLALHHDNNNNMSNVSTVHKVNTFGQEVASPTLLHNVGNIGKVETCYTVVPQCGDDYRLGKDLEEFFKVNPLFHFFLEKRAELSKKNSLLRTFLEQRVEFLSLLQKRKEEEDETELTVEAIGFIEITVNTCPCKIVCRVQNLCNDPYSLEPQILVYLKEHTNGDEHLMDFERGYVFKLDLDGEKPTAYFQHAVNFWRYPSSVSPYTYHS
jgi:hypothetical protein